jgi:HK97 family phage prohead protease
MRVVENTTQLFESKLLEADAASRTVRYVLSTKTADRMNDTIDPNGWRLDNYRKNPVLLLNHDKRSLPIGKALSVGVQGGQLVGTYQFATADEYPIADTCFKLVKGGYMPGGSVGFMPIKYVFNEETAGVDFLEQELLEFSAVTVPCNPDAMCMSYPAVKALGVSLKQFDELRAALAAVEKGATAPCNPERLVARANANRLKLIGA